MAQQNRELVEQVNVLAKRLNLSVQTENLNNQQLQETLTDLQRRESENTSSSPSRERAPGGATSARSGDQRLPDGGGTEAAVTRVAIGDPQPNGGIVANAPVDVQRAQKETQGTQQNQRQRYPYAVAPGKSITSPRGIIDAGEEVRMEDVGGMERLNALVERGVILSSSSEVQQARVTVEQPSNVRTEVRQTPPSDKK